MRQGFYKNFSPARNGIVRRLVMEKSKTQNTLKTDRKIFLKVRAGLAVLLLALIAGMFPMPANAVTVTISNEAGTGPCCTTPASDVVFNVDDLNTSLTSGDVTITAQDIVVDYLVYNLGAITRTLTLDASTSLNFYAEVRGLGGYLNLNFPDKLPTYSSLSKKDLQATVTSPGPPARYVAPSTSNHVFYEIKLEVTHKSTLINVPLRRLTVTYNGSCGVYNFKLWYSADADFDSGMDSQLSVFNSSTCTNSTISFKDFTKELSLGEHWLFVTADTYSYASTSESGYVEGVSMSDFEFEGGSVLLSGTPGNGGVQTLASRVQISSAAIPSATVVGGTANHVLYQLRLTPESASYFYGLTVGTAGTYLAANIANFKLYYSTDSVLDEADSQIASKTSASTGTGETVNFSGTQYLSQGQVAYLFMTADIAATDVDGRTISVTATDFDDITVGNAKTGAAPVPTDGPVPAGGEQTFANNVQIDSPAIGAASAIAGTEDHLIYRFDVAPSAVGTVVTDASFTTAGSYTSGDILRFKLYHSADNVLDLTVPGDVLLKTVSPAGSSGETVAFSGISTPTIDADTTGYFFVTADVAAVDIATRNVSIAADLRSKITLGSGAIINGTTNLSVGGTQTFANNVDVSSPATATALATKDTTNHVLYKLLLTETSGDTDAQVSGVSVTTAGTYLLADIANFKLYYSADNVFAPASDILLDTQPSAGPGAVNFTGLSQVIAAGSTGYFFVTADVSLIPVSDRTINIVATPRTDITLAAGAVIGGASLAAGGVQTLKNQNKPAITQGASVSVSMSEDSSPTAWIAPTVEATDADGGDTLTWSKYSDPSNGSASVSGTGTSSVPAVISYSPPANWYGSDSFIAQVDDGNGGTAKITINVTVSSVDDPLYLSSGIPNVTVNEDSASTTLDITNVFRDTDIADPATISKSVLSNDNPGLVTVSGGNILTLSYAAEQSGTAQVIIRGSSGGVKVDDEFTVTVNPVDDPPTLARAIPDMSVMEQAENTTIYLTNVFSDIDSPVISKIILSNNNPAVVGASISDDILTLTYQKDQNGTAIIVIRASSGSFSVDDEFSVIVSPVDGAPVVANEITDVEAREDGENTTIDLSAVFTDADSDDAAIAKTLGTNSNIALVSASIEGNILSLDYQADQSGTADITVIASSGGKTVSDTFAVTVIPTDDAPTVAKPLSDIATGEKSPDRIIDLSPVFTDMDNEDSEIVKSLESNSDESLVVATVLDNSLILDYQGRHGTALIRILGTSGGKTVSDEFSVTISELVYSISGQIRYFGGENPPVPDVTMLLIGDGAYYVSNTDDTGNYVFHAHLNDYVVFLSKKTNDRVPVSATDASRISRYVVGKYEFSENEAAAADVTRNGTVSSLDATRVARYATGLIDAMNDKGINWTFSPESKAWSPLDSDMENQNFTAIMIGDVSGSHSPARSHNRLVNEGRWQGTETGESPEDRISVPIVLSEEATIEGIDIDLEYDRDVLRLADATLTGGILEDEDYELIVNAKVPGKLTFAIFAKTDMYSDSGTVVFVNFHVIGTDRNGHLVRLTNFRCNEVPAAHEVYINDDWQDPQVEYKSAEYDPLMYDLNESGRLGIEDAVYALREGDLEIAVRILQWAVGLGIGE